MQATQDAGQIAGRRRRTVLAATAVVLVVLWLTAQAPAAGVGPGRQYELECGRPVPVEGREAVQGIAR
jgi:hypothetical protein